MNLSLHTNAITGQILICFDEEGRRFWLDDMAAAIREQDHSFGLPDDGPTESHLPGDGWTQVEFYNIVCLAEPDAPLHIDNCVCSVIIEGGSAALSQLYEEIRALPQCITQFELSKMGNGPQP